MKAFLKNYRMSPQKVRLVTDAVKGKNVADADVELSFMPKKAARIIRKLIRSAAQNAVVNDGKEKDNLKIANIEVNQGVTLKRYRPRARGSAFPINKRTSNVTVTLSEIAAKPAEEKKEEKKTETKKAPAKKPAAKKKTTKKVEKKEEVKESKTDKK